MLCVYISTCYTTKNKKINHNRNKNIWGCLRIVCYNAGN